MIIIRRSAGTADSHQKLTNTLTSMQHKFIWWSWYEDQQEPQFIIRSFHARTLIDYPHIINWWSSLDNEQWKQIVIIRRYLMIINIKALIKADIQMIGKISEWYQIKTIFTKSALISHNYQLVLFVKLTKAT